MLYYQSKILSLVAFVLILGTVAPVIVSAESSAVVTNSVYSSSQTGGVSQTGEAGESGQDGQNGRDGQAGADGADGVSGQSGESSASASVTNYIDGSESHTVITVATSGGAIVQLDNTSFVTTGHSGEVEKPTSNVSSEAPEFQLLSILLLLQETLTAYVQKLF